MLKDDFHYFLDHQKELYEKYPNKYLVIKDKTVEGDYDTEIEAYQEASKTFELGTFLIQHCLPDLDSITQTFHTHRVTFAGI